MKKIAIIITIFTILIFNITYATSSNLVELDLNYDGKTYKYSSEEIKINLDTKKIVIEDGMQPIIIENRTLVPLRSVLEKMGASVFWDSAERKVSITKDSDTVIFEINSNFITKNSSEKIEIDVPAKIINNFTMIPIRAIAQAFNCTVEWEASTKTINIYTQNFNSSTVNLDTEVNSKSGGITLVWDQISNTSANNLESKKQPIQGLDVLSPTWFAIYNNSGDITDKGSLEYVTWAKKQGYQLWGLVTNSFDSVITHNALSNKETRTKIINTLCELSEKYSLDGINIDFESVAKEDGDYYLQFIKEATPIFKSKGLIVSVDMYIPKPWTDHYHMEEVGKIVDYVIIMAYDEHYSTSKESGSTASISWVDSAMADAVKLVDNNKLIMGVPFYTRVWSEETQKDGTLKVTSKSLTMNEAYNLLTSNNAELIWLEDAGQFYGQYVENGIVKKIWLEDENSIEERMKISRKYDVAGIACWKRGHEKEGVWDIINKYYK